MSKGLPVPHIGWNTLHQARSSDLLASVAPSDRVYFVHSYRLVPVDGWVSERVGYWLVGWLLVGGWVGGWVSG